MGMVQRLRGNDAAARQAFVAALKLNPSNPDAMREMRRNERERKDTAPPGEEKPAAGFFARLFGKK
jgi:Tfp pilus assembly protein PilF